MSISIENINKKKEEWRGILRHIITVVKHQAFCETNAKRYEVGYDNFLGLVEF